MAEQETNFTEDEKRTYLNFNETMRKYLESEDKVAADIAQHVINNILRQFNSSSLKGYLNQQQHEQLLDTSGNALFEIVYLKGYETADTYDFVSRDEIFWSSFNLIVLYLSLAFDGRLYELEKLRIEASKTTNLKLQQ